MRRRQRTVHMDGCRVLLRWTEPLGKIGMKVTDPAGDEALELAVAARAVGALAEAFTKHGIPLNIGPLAHIDDHGGAA